MTRFRCLAILSGLATAPAAAQWTVIYLNPAGATFSVARGGGGGQQVGRAVVGTSGGASLWSGTAASWVDLGPAGSTNSFAYGADGNQQAGYATLDGVSRSLWRGTAASWMDLNPLGATGSAAYGIHSGHLVGSVTLGGGSHAALWNDATAPWVDLNPADSVSSIAWGVDDNQQAGESTDATGLRRASLWSGSPGSWTNLNPTGSTQSNALGVGGGQQAGWAVIGGLSHQPVERLGRVVGGPDPCRGDRIEHGCVDAGRQAGSATFGGIDHAGVWNGTPGSWVDLHAVLPSGFVSSLATTGIWHEGAHIYVVGIGYHSGGPAEALMWVWTAPCYPNCDNSTIAPILNVNDFVCFLNHFASGDPSANCDESTTPPTLNISDFTCFINAFATGCP